MIKIVNEDPKAQSLKDVLSDLYNNFPKEGEEVYIETKDGFDVSLFWHDPSINVNWYPILQIDDREGNTLFNGEGPENPDYFNKVVKRAIDKFYK